MARPPRLCTCGKIVAHNQRCECQTMQTRQRNKRHDRKRPTAAQRGYNNAWRKARDAFLKINDRCAWPRCGALATVVDHIVAHRGDKVRFWDRSNWQPLCKPCHDRRKQKQERA
ncbi:HNH endonuclease [Sulfitobacter geojensis]|uniref:Putative HNH nuclease YajD n=2 Tax=Sulfitobacter geojensis TaxID=1342299 RepID=A0AAE3B5J0_9RHOB|nr:HNH endonuclease [Sulfitobacter geojensis]MBM1692899.1 HNH endonuclease [Sulfitobacter geojensis]MBM1705065.1 HNH endonuclease [Sulfitobacter geojensis]MBM1709123.1 HNH endonuclease [Sulfitobacter geojensis]MBM1713188.1 HNH endonuclease [Sulfitobacter geojensis]